MSHSRPRTSLETIFTRLVTRNEHLDRLLWTALCEVRLHRAVLTRARQILRHHPPARLAACSRRLEDQMACGVDSERDWEILCRPSLQEISSRSPGRLLRV